MGGRNIFIACLLWVFLGANALYETEISASSDSLQDELKMIELEGVRLYADRKHFMRRIKQGHKFDVQLKFGKEYIKSLQLSILELLKWAEDSATSKRKNGYVTLPLYWHINLDEWEKDREKELECTVRMTRKMWFLRPSTVGEAKFTFDDFEKFTTVNFGDGTSLMALEDTPIVKRLKTPIGLFKNTNMEFIASPRTWTRQYAYGAVPEKKKRRKCSLLFCQFQKGIFAELINGVVDNSKYPREAQYLEPPRDKPTPELRREVKVVKDENKKPVHRIEYPMKDEHVNGPYVNFFSRILKLQLIFPKDDKRDYDFRGDRSYAINRVRHSLKDSLDLLRYGNTTGKDGVGWDDALSDDALTRAFFFSIGQHSMRRIETGYVADLMYFQKLRIRDGYENPACRAYFDDRGAIQMIEEPDPKYPDKFIQYFPANNTSSKDQQWMWEWIKQKLRTAAFIHSGTIHLMSAHYTWGNYAGTALRMYLEKDHPFRIALTPHFYRTAFTLATASPLLFSPDGLLSRLMSFEYKGGMEKIYEIRLDEANFSTWTDHLASLNLQDDPLIAIANDGVELNQILNQYVSDLIDYIYPDDESVNNDEGMKEVFKYIYKHIVDAPEQYSKENLKKVWGEILFRVTGFHSSVGNVQPWLLDPTILNMRLRRPPIYENGTIDFSDENFRWDLVAPTESAVGAAAIGVVAVMPAPTLTQDWGHLFETKEASVTFKDDFDAYKDLRSALLTLDDTIKKRNNDSTGTRYPCLDFLPSEVEIAVTG